MATTSFPTSLSSEALLPVLTAQLGSELLAKQVIKTLEKAAENEARKKQQQQSQSVGTSPSSEEKPVITSASSPIIFPPNYNNNNNNNNGITTLNHHHQKSAFLPVSTTTNSLSHPIVFPIPKPLSSFIQSPLPTTLPTSAVAVITSSPSVLSTSNIQNVPPIAFSRPSTPRSSRASSSFRHPSPSTSACSLKSTSSTINSSSDKPFAVNVRGRKRVYTDEERRLRKNNSSKKSREKHTEAVMEKKMKLQQLQDKHQRLIEKRQQLDREIQEHRQHLCPYCLNVVEEALREIGKGQDIVVLKRVNFCCSTYHSQKQQHEQQQSPLEDELPHTHTHTLGQQICQRQNNSSRHGSNDDVIFDKVIKHEPSEFSG